MTKISVLQNIPTPYKRRLWMVVRDIPSICIKVYYGELTKSGRSWKISVDKSDHEENFRLGDAKGYIKYFYSIIKIIEESDIVMVGGWSKIYMVYAIILCNIKGTSYVIIHDGNRGGHSDIIKQYVKKWIIANCAAFFGAGEVSRRYALKLGLPEQKFFNQYLTVDVDRFIKNAKKEYKYEYEIKNKNGIKEGSFVLLYVGRLVKEKGIYDLAVAYKEILNQIDNIHLIIVGDGKEKNLLRKMLPKEKASFTGHVKYEKVHEYYYASDLFVFPTWGDTWGLVINEAMACGLPIVTTKSAGAHYDLIDENGLVCEKKDKKCLKKSILKYYRNEKKCKIHGKRSLEIIKNYTYEESKKEILAMVDHVE